MKCVQRNKLDFSGQNIYVGIDVHLKKLVGCNFIRAQCSEAIQPKS